MQKFYYVYILVDITTETHHYTGVTEDLHARLAKHNAGEVPHTSKFKPWKVEAYFAFETKKKQLHLNLISKLAPDMLSPNATFNFSLCCVCLNRNLCKFSGKYWSPTFMCLVLCNLLENREL